MMSPVCGFQQSVLLSLPQDKRRSESCLHQETDRTPFEWPVNTCPSAYKAIGHAQMALTRSGARVFRTFHTIMTG